MHLSRRLTSKSPGKFSLANYCFQNAHSQTIPQLVFVAIQAGECSFNLSRVVL